MKLAIRLAHLKDLFKLQKLFVDVISATCSQDYNPDQIGAWISAIENVDRWKRLLLDHYTLVAILDDDTIVGFGTLANSEEIDMLYTHKDFLGHGIASAIYIELEKLAIESGATILKSDVSKTAKPFFLNRGFTTIRNQSVVKNGIELVNFKMTKFLHNAF